MEISNRFPRYVAGLLCTLCILTGFRVAAADTRSFDIEVKNSEIVGATVIRVVKGDTVRLRWRSDTAMSLHLHGYDVEFDIGPGAAKSVTIDAFATGRFPVTRHGAGHGHRALMHIEVHPD